MSTTTPIAIDEAAAIMLAAASAYPAAEIRWHGRESNTPPAADATWYRWSMQHTDGYQASLSCEEGQRRWRREGFIAVQCFAPLDGGGLTLAQRMAEVIRDAYQGLATASGMWFRNATTQEVGPDGPHYQVNVIVRFEYDEIKGGALDPVYPPVTAPYGGAPDTQYDFPTPAVQWVVNHNLNRRVSVEAYTLGGQLIWASVQHVSLNQVIISFDAPQSGYAIIDY
jgi:hypothetical protein